MDDHLYRFPFTSDYVNSERAMIALFSQPLQRDLPSKPIHWTRLKDTKAVVKDLGDEKVATSKASLRAFTYYQTASGAVQFVHIILQIPQARQYIVNATSGRIVQMIPGKKPLLVHLSSGNDSRLGFTVHRRDGAGQVFFTPGPVVVGGLPQVQLPVKSNSFAAILKDGKVIFRRQYSVGDLPLLPDLNSVFGFIFQEVVHLWNFASKTVYLFKVPPSGDLSLLSPLGTELRSEPMSSYFLCSRESWLLKLNSNPPEVTTSDSEEIPTSEEDEVENFNWLLIGLLSAVLMILVFIFFVVSIYYRVCGKQQKLSHHFLRRRPPRKTPQRSPAQRSPHQMRKGVQQKKVKVSFSPQTSSVPSSQADSSVLVRRMFADRAPSSSLASLKSCPEDTHTNGTPKTLFKAKLIDFGGAKTKPINATEKKSVIGPEKKLVVPLEVKNAEKTVNIGPEVVKQSLPVNTLPKTNEKPAVKTKLLSKVPITDRNSFVESK